MIVLTHYFCDFNCLLFLLNDTLLREVFFCRNLTFTRLTLKAIYVLCALSDAIVWGRFVICSVPSALFGVLFLLFGFESYEYIIL
jgi:hypothetical protein